MQGVEGLFTDEKITAAHIDIAPEEATAMEKPTAGKTEENYYEDDDVKQTVKEKEPVQTEIFDAQPTDAGQQFIKTAASFFTQLSHVLSNPAATESLVQSITKKDEAGQTYLQIPVENEAVVKNAFALLAGLFKGMGGK